MAGSNPSMLIRIAADTATLKKNLAEGRTQIETTTAAMQKMASGLDGSKLEQKAHNTAAAINEVGGATKLTDAEVKRHLATLDAWITKADRLGKEVPADILKTRDAMARMNEEANKTPGKFGAVTTSLRGFDGALSSVGLSIGPQVTAMEEIGKASGKSAKELGAVTTAGLAIGAFMAGWKIGRAIADFFDLDQKIGNATAKLLGWGDVAGQVGGAKQDSINLAIKRGAAAMIDYAGAIKFNEEWQKRFNEGGAKVAESAKKTADAVTAAWKQRQAAAERAAEAEVRALKEGQARIASSSFAGPTLKMMGEEIKTNEIPLLNKWADTLKLPAVELEHVADGMLYIHGVSERAWPGLIGDAKIYAETWEKGGRVFDKAKNSLGDLMQAAGALSQLGGGGKLSSVFDTFGSVLGGFGTAGAGSDQFHKEDASTTSKIAGLALMATGYGAVAMAAFKAGKAIFQAMNDGRKAVEDFAKSSGGFDALHASMADLGAEGERLWIKLTQGTKKGDQKGAAAVIEEITAALEKQKQKTAEVAAATQAAAEAQAAAIETISAKYSEQLSKLDSEAKSLTASVAAEAEEAVMGNQEMLDRARLDQIKIEQAALETQKAAEIAASEENYDAQVEAAKTADKAIREIFSKPARMPIEFEYPGGASGSTSSSASGAASSARTAAAASRGGSAQAVHITVVSKIDGREVARNQSRHLPSALRAAGI